MNGINLDTIWLSHKQKFITRYWKASFCERMRVLYRQAEINCMSAFLDFWDLQDSVRKIDLRKCLQMKRWSPKVASIQQSQKAENFTYSKEMERPLAKPAVGSIYRAGCAAAVVHLNDTQDSLREKSSRPRLFCSDSVEETFSSNDT